MIKKLEVIQNKLLEKINLSYSETNFLVRKIFNKEIDEVCLSSILTFLYIKGESYEEIKSFVSFLKQKSIKIKFSGEYIDTCGTGGDNKGSFNFSTAASIVLSSFNVKVVKHGNRSITSKSGSFDVIEALGIKLLDNPSTIKKYFEKNGICFLFAPFFHPILADVAPIRKSLFFRTIFNLLGPLLNPSTPQYQVIGVSNEKNLETHSKCLRDFNIKKAWVVHNFNGYDELTTVSKNKVVEINNNRISEIQIIDPKALGFKKHSEKELLGGNAEENAFVMKKVFQGETGPIKDNIVLNAAAGLVITNNASNIKEAIEMVNYNITNGIVIKKLNSLIKG